MNKKLLAAAVAAAVVAAPAAFADAVVYGKFHTSIDQIDNNTNVDNWQVNGRASRLGFKGSEDLGNGLKAIYQLELGFNSDGGGTGQNGASSGLGGGSRNTFVGLSGGWGTFIVGRHDTPMKMAFYAAGNEVLGDSAIDLNMSNSLAPTKSDTSPIGVFSEYRANNAIAYVSPSFGGFSFTAAIIPGEDTVGPNARDGIADHYSLGAMYKGGGLKASLGYQETDSGTVQQETMQVGASYSFGMFQIGGQYEKTDNFAFVNNDDYDAFAVVGKVKFGNSAVSLVYTDSELDNNYESQGWGLAADHSLSKRTKVYAAYATDERDPAGGGASTDVDVFSLGVIHDF
jgi:predicted porin